MKRHLTAVLVMVFIFQALLIFPQFAFAEEAISDEPAEEIVYTLTFIVDGKVAQSRYAPAGEALGPLPQIWASDGEILCSWHCGDTAVSSETIATADMVLTAEQGEIGDFGENGEIS